MRSKVRIGMSAALAGCLLAAPTTRATTYTVVVLDHQGFQSSAGYGFVPGGTQAVGHVNGPGNSHAALWTGPARSFVDLGAGSNFMYTDARATDGLQQVGFGETNSFHMRGLVWSGTAASAIDLTPAAFTDSSAYAVFGGRQGGVVSNGNGPVQAALWSGSPGSFQSLNPSGFAVSDIVAMDAVHQVGSASVTGETNHAFLWSGSASTGVDLAPVGFGNSGASGLSGNQVVGAGVSAIVNQQHALLWAAGTASSAVDLNPMGSVNSSANGTNGFQQIGDAGDPTNGILDAFVWSGTAASGVDLQQFVPAKYNASSARGIDANGDIFGTAFYDGGSDAVVWVPTSASPEPGSFGLLSLSSLWLLRRRGFRRIIQ